MKESLSYKRGRVFAAVGCRRYGPYGVGAYRSKRAVAKASIGPKGVSAGGTYRVYNQVRVGGECNFTHRKRALEVRFGRKRFRIEA